MAVVLWAGLRQLEALRGAFFVSLTQGAASSTTCDPDIECLIEWAEKEGLGTSKIKVDWDTLRTQFDVGDIGLTPLNDTAVRNTYRMSILWQIAVQEHSKTKSFVLDREGARITDEIAPDVDFGAERSSAGWDRYENFLTTSALVRFLGALEQFEIDALKSLLFYRPLGTAVPVDEYSEESVDESVVCEQPRKEGDVLWFEKPALWTWLRKSALENNQRRQIFSRVYGIKFPKPKFGWSLGELYEKRNAIAHGRDFVEVTISDLARVHGYVIDTMALSCLEIFKRYKLKL